MYYIIYETTIYDTAGTCYIVRCASRYFFPSHTHTHTHHNVFSLPERLFQTLFHADGWKYYKKHFIFAGRADGVYVYTHIYVCVDL